MFTGLIRRFSSEDTELDVPSQEADIMHGKDGINDVFIPSNMRRASPFRPPPLEPVCLHGYKDNTNQDSRLLNEAVAEEIRTMVPERLKLAEEWKLVYSLEQDGSSLSTLFQKCKAHEGERVGFVLVVRDEDDCTFGAYLSEYPHPAPSYFGNGECFLWRVSTLPSLPPPPSADTTNLFRSTTLASPTRDSHGHGDMIRFKAFPYSGLNDCYINCEAGFLSVGSGGGKYGLWLDDTLDIGHSSTCDTFGNEPLSDVGEKFNVVGVEVWVLGA